MGGFKGKAFRALMRADRALLTATFGKPISEGYECLVFPATEGRVRKQYTLQNFRSAIEFHRTPEWTYLDGVNDPHVVRAFEHGFRHLILERLGAPLGDYAGIRHVEDPDALAAFLEGIEGALVNAGLKHHDIHPGNVLYHPGERMYKLIDFGWARRHGEQGYLLPSFINPHYSADDRHSIEKLKREAQL